MQIFPVNPLRFPVKRKMASPVPSPDFILIQQRRRQRSVSVSRLMESAPLREDVIQAIAKTELPAPNPEDRIRADGFETFLRLVPSAGRLPAAPKARGDYLEELFSPLLLEALAYVDTARDLSDTHGVEALMALLQAYISAQWTIGARDAAMHLYSASSPNA
ncbi:hypothetical protein KOEU_29800 [Komagataeibacter europaeus]|uniref:Uncharacterized protein n=9 Tax=Acetobacteraceae TaxID=433 RepID=A0A318PUR5_9PROT|nr:MULTISPECIES: hypothetical protein [Acetobacteraceae]MBE7619836.1 hypothetical protein [Komagataeibacter sp. FXV2]MCE2580628.1 hypothetical protein [Komagataeibacter sp. FNDCR1]KDU95086.1 hypothetical protein GLUCORHAEAF1_10195 [Komagataeibacter rhaeticus AF1]KON63508.1 hypothetical protein KOEU_29800 [Komagataeibacter europaeus]MCE2580682.1 hypothetical protein [Komagataeibacter sp. FNDCR1]